MEINSFKNWLTLEEIVDRAPLQVTPNTSVLEAIALMSGEQGSGCVLVVDGKRLVSIFTERDVVRLIGAGRNLSQIKIEQAIASPVISLTLDENQNTLTALSVMHQHQIRYLPLVDELGQLVGLVTQERLYRAIAPEQILALKQITPSVAEGCEKNRLTEMSILPDIPLYQTLHVGGSKQTEAALKASAEKYRTLFESIDQGFCIIEMIFDENNKPVDYRFLEINPTFEQQTGLTNAQGKRIREMAPNLEAHWFEICGSVALTGKPVRFENRAEELHRWFDVYAFQFGAPENLQVAVLFQDVSPRKQAEAALRENEQLLRLALVGAQAGSWDWELTTNKLTWSPETYRLYGLDQANGLPEYEGWYDNLLHPDDRTRVNAYMLQAIAQRLPEIELEFRILHPQQGIRWILSRGCSTLNEQGELIRLSGINLDISDRKQGEQKIAEQAALIDIATDAILVRNLDNHILFWSQGAERLYGWKAAEVLGKIDHDLFHIKYSSQLTEALNFVVKQGFWQGELEQVTKSRKEIIVASRWTLVRDESGQPKSILVVNSDITEKKKLEQQFYHAQRLESIGTLASGIAHDFNNLLTPILAIAQLLPLKFSSLDDQTRQMLTMLEDSAKRGAALIKQVLSFSRGTEGKRVIIQLGQLLEEVVSIAQRTFPKSIDISKDIPTQQLGLISADSTQIHQVFMNILVNARDAMPNGGHLTISAQNRYLDENYARMNLAAQVGSYVAITISDTGTGIPPELMERIFDPFFTTKEVGKGTGLGLATVLGIVKNYGGFVKVDSEIGKGTQFQVFLPAVAGAISQPNSENELPKGNGELILIVDDEQIIREIAKTSLENYNYRTLTASDGIEAIAIYAKQQSEISVVLMDMMMPNLDGLTAMHTMQRMNPQVKVIPTSGLPAIAQNTFPVNIKTFLSKPYTLEELLNAIKLVTA